MKNQKRVVFTAGLLAAIVFTAPTWAVTDKQRAEIEARIKPAGEVCTEVDTTCGGATETVAVARSGEEVYNAACMACHMTGAAGAPILGDVAAWADRIAKGTEALYDGGINGIPGTGMMARGACMDCSDEDVIAAVDYMIEKSQ